MMSYAIRGVPNNWVMAVTFITFGLVELLALYIKRTPYKVKWLFFGLFLAIGLVLLLIAMLA